MAEKSSYATYLVEGLNTEKNLNFLCGNGICLYEVKKINKKQYFVTVPFKERKKLIALLKNRCYNIKLIKSGGFLGFLEKGGLSATLRRQIGSDVGGACGQLRAGYLEKNSDKESL